MSIVFLKVLSLSVSGSMLAAVVLLLQKIIHNRFSQQWHYYIWLVVLLRLLLPFSFGFLLTDAIVEDIQRPMEPVIVTEQPGEAREWTENKEAAGEPSVLQKPGQPATNLTLFLMSANRYLWILWAVGAGILFVKKFVGYKAFLQFVKVGCKQVEDEHLIDVYFKACEEQNIRWAPGLYTNTLMTAPMLVGVFRPFIVLPEIPEENTNIGHILQHELIHYKRGDIFYKWLAQLAVCIHWFNPLLYLINRRINLSCELSCDEALIRHMDEEQKYWYGETLLSTVRPLKGYTNKTVSVALNEDAQHLKERLESIVKYREKNRMISALTALVSLVLITGATTLGVSAAVGSPGTTANQAESQLDHASNILFAYSNVNLYVDGGYSGAGGDLTIPKDTILQVQLQMSSTSGEMSFAIQKYGADNLFSDGMIVDPQTREPINVLYHKTGNNIDDTTTISLGPGKYFIAITGQGPLRGASYSFTGTAVTSMDTPATYRDALAPGLVDLFEARRTIYNNDTWIANASLRDIQAKGPMNWKYPDDTTYILTAGEAAGCMSLYEFNVNTSCTLTVDYNITASGRTKLVFVDPNGTVTVLAELTEGNQFAAKTVTLPGGSSQIKMVMDASDVELEVRISGSQAVQQATMLKIAE